MRVKNKYIRGRSIFYFFLIAAIYVTDQFTKSIAQNSINLGETVPVIPDIFHLTLVHNTGAAFGMLRGRPYLFTGIAVIFSVAVSYIIFYGKAIMNEKEKTALSLMLGGTLGNLADRLRFGYVIDFLDLRIWPVFNVADSFITFGALTLVFFMIAGNRRTQCTE